MISSHIQIFALVGNPTKIYYSVQQKKSAIVRLRVYSKRGYPLLSKWKPQRRYVPSDNSWFWIYKKQATGVAILVDTVKCKADIIS